MNQLDNSDLPQLDSAAFAQLPNARRSIRRSLRQPAAQLDKTPAAQLESSAGPQPETSWLESAARAPKETAFCCAPLLRGKRIQRPLAAELFLEMLSDAFFELLRAESPAGKLLDEIASQERLQDDPLFDRDPRDGPGSECEKLALLLEPRQSRDQRFAGLHGMLNAIHQLLKAQMKRNGGIVELIRLRKVILGRFDCVGPGDNVPDCAAIVSDLDRVFGTGRLYGNIPVPCFKRDFDLDFYLFFALVDAEKCGPPG